MHYFDLWDDSNGNYAYVETNIDKQLMDELEETFLAANPRKENEEDESYYNRFFEFLREKGHQVKIINRPWDSIRLDLV